MRQSNGLVDEDSGMSLHLSYSFLPYISSQGAYAATQAPRFSGKVQIGIFGLDQGWEEIWHGPSAVQPACVQKVVVQHAEPFVPRRATGPDSPGIDTERKLYTGDDVVWDF